MNMVSRKPPARFSLPLGQRVYAIGDIHGRIDLLDLLLEMIGEDRAKRDLADTILIFLGDLVDRGPDSRRVVERLLKLSREAPETRFLKGNHEEVFLKALGNDVGAMRFLIKIGGRETVRSYGITDEEYRALDYPELTARLAECVPTEHVQFLSSFERYVEKGDYVFVHAGVRPGLGLDEQSDADLCWIRNDFLMHRDSFGKMVVHGHSITNEVDMRSNRIGIDTGAYASGRLTALGLEGDSRWILST